jgi:hypothetical protein
MGEHKMEIIELGDHGLNGRNEDWWSLKIDDQGRKFLVHRWSYLPYNGGPNVGETETPLAKAEGEDYYSQAIAAAEKWDKKS